MNKTTLAGVFIVGIMALAALAAPWLTPCQPAQIDAGSILCAPSSAHLLGTDSLGRDVLSRLIYGSRISLSVGIIAVGISTLLGVFFGALAGFYGKTADALIMRIVDVMLCFPTFFLILAAVAFLDTSIFNIMVIIGLTNWMGPARLVRAEIMALKEREFVEAARASGVSNLRIIVRHMLPNACGPLLVNATLSVAGAILLESGLSFLGLGVQPPVPSWGNMLTEAKATLGVAWWITVFPGSAIFLAISGFNFIAEGIRKDLG